MLPSGFFFKPFLTSLSKYFVVFLLISVLAISEPFPLQAQINTSQTFVKKSEDVSLQKTLSVIQNAMTQIQAGAGSPVTNHFIARSYLMNGALRDQFFGGLPGYDKLAADVNTAVKTFEDAMKTDDCKCGGACGTLLSHPFDFASPDAISYELLKYEKAKAYPFNSGDASVGNQIYAAIVVRDQSVISAMNTMLNTVLSHYTALVQANSDAFIPFSELTVIRNQLNTAAGKLTGAAGMFAGYRLARYQELYDAESAKYDAYANYWNALYDIWKSVYGSDKRLTDNGGDYRTIARQGFERLKWRGQEAFRFNIEETTQWCSCREDDNGTCKLRTGTLLSSCPMSAGGGFSSQKANLFESEMNDGSYSSIGTAKTEFKAGLMTNPDWRCNTGCADHVADAKYDYFEDKNLVYQEVKNARVTLNSALQDYAEKTVERGAVSYPVISEHSNPWSPLIGGCPTCTYNTMVNNYDGSVQENDVPVIQIAAATPGTVTLIGNPAVIFSAHVTDPESDTLHYRWILTQIPATDTARSKQYALYQVLSTAPTAELHPDLAGGWKVRLEVTDSRVPAEPSKSQEVTVIANRLILHIDHDDGKIGLEKAPSDEGDFYLEKTNSSAAAYRNFATIRLYDVKQNIILPQDVPTDQATDYNSTNAAFKLVCINAKNGMYDGQYGSSNVQAGLWFHMSGGGSLIDLKSSHWSESRKKGYIQNALITVSVHNDFTHLVIQKTAPIERHGTGYDGLTGYFSIKQWVDNILCVNRIDEPNSAFVCLPKEQWQLNPQMSYPTTEDWMEVYAAETINQDAIYRRHVMYINDLRGSGQGDRYGKYAVGTQTIQISPLWKEIRLNRKGRNGYGFYFTKTLFDVSLHESHHAYYYRSIEGKPNHPIVDLDGDRLPNPQLANGSPAPKYEYLLDSPYNAHGSYGPSAAEESRSYDYKGDQKNDEAEGKIKKFTIPVSLAVSSNGLLTSLPSSISVSESAENGLPPQTPLREARIERATLHYIQNGQNRKISISGGILQYRVVTHNVLTAGTSYSLHIDFKNEFMTMLNQFLSTPAAQGIQSLQMVIWVRTLSRDKVLEYDASKINVGATGVYKGVSERAQPERWTVY